MEERHKVLVVDDELDIREALQELLELIDLEVVTASSGREALELMGLMGDELRLIVSDYRMPGMDGLEFLAKAEKLRPKVARVLVTAYAETTLAVRAVNEARIARFLSKPIEPALMEGMVKELIAAGQAERNRTAAMERTLDLLKKREAGADPKKGAPPS